DPELVLSAPRDYQFAMAFRLGFLCRGAHRVPFAFASLRPLRTDARSRDAPRAGRLRIAGPVSEMALNPCKPFRLQPQVDRRFLQDGFPLLTRRGGWEIAPEKAAAQCDSEYW